MPFRFHSLTVAAVVSALMIAITQPVTAQDASERTDAAEMARIDRSWNRYWREVAPFYVRHDDTFVCVPGYDRRLPSSSGVTAAEYQKQTAREVPYKDERGRERLRTEVKPDAEAEAVTRSLIEVKPGAYGHILSGKIEKIVDGQTLILDDIWLVDAAELRDEKGAKMGEVRKEAWGEVEERIRDFRDGRRERRDTIAALADQMRDYVEWSYAGREELAQVQLDSVYRQRPWRVVGYQTGRLNSGDRWPSEQTLQLVVISVSRDEVVAIPAAKIGSGLNELQMLDCLDSRGISKTEFVELYTKVRAEHRRDYVPHLLAAVEGWDMHEQHAGGDDAGDEVRLAE